MQQLYTHLTDTFMVFGGRSKSHESISDRFSKKERADDNFTKKPQKKLIRYMVLFWGSSTNS